MNMWHLSGFYKKNMVYRFITLSFQKADNFD